MNWLRRSERIHGRLHERLCPQKCTVIHDMSLAGRFPQQAPGALDFINPRSDHRRIFTRLDADGVMAQVAGLVDSGQAAPADFLQEQEYAL